MILSDPVYDVQTPPVRRKSIEPAITPPAVPSPTATPTKDKPGIRRKSTGFTDVISEAAKEIENQIKTRRKSAPAISPPPSRAAKDRRSPSAVSGAGEARESLAELKETRRKSVADEKAHVTAGADVAEARRKSLTEKEKGISAPVYVRKPVVIPPLALKSMNRLGDKDSVDPAPREERYSLMADDKVQKPGRSSSDLAPVKKEKSKKRERVKRPNLGVAGGGKGTKDSPVTDDAGDERARRGERSSSDRRSTSDKRRSISYTNDDALSEGEGDSDEDSGSKEDSQQKIDHEAELRELGLLLPTPDPPLESTDGAKGAKGKNNVDPRKSYQKGAIDGQRRDSFCARFFCW